MYPVTDVAIETTPVYDKLWSFAAERQNLFFKRAAGHTNNLTEDKILLRYRFTNAYRAADRVSQYLIDNVIYEGDQDPNEVALRILLFKTFNKIETWELLRSRFGEIRISGFSVSRYNEVLSSAQQKGIKIYSAAYIMPSGRTFFGSDRKHFNHLMLIKKMIEDRIGDRVAETKSLKDLYNLLLNYPTIGPFLAFQYAIDINYSELTNFSEMDYVIAGPGARSGIEKCFRMRPKHSHEDLIRHVTDSQEQEFERRGLNFKTLWGRPLQLIDVQNLFCEIDKYSRAALPEYRTGNGRCRIKRLYRPNPTRIDYWFPPKWGINERLHLL